MGDLRGGGGALGLARGAHANQQTPSAQEAGRAERPRLGRKLKGQDAAGACPAPSQKRMWAAAWACRVRQQLQPAWRAWLYQYGCRLSGSVNWVQWAATNRVSSSSGKCKGATDIGAKWVLEGAGHGRPRTSLEALIMSTHCQCLRSELQQAVPTTAAAADPSQHRRSRPRTAAAASTLPSHTGHAVRQTAQQRAGRGGGWGVGWPPRSPRFASSSQ